MKSLKSVKSPYKLNLLVGFLLNIANIHGVSSAPAQSPLFIGTAVAPKVMINMSKDHQLYYKAFDDYSDLDADNVPDTTYKHSFDYYGYFDSHKCYLYSTTNSRFEPVSITSDKYCEGSTKWSGNFLNWATMSRMDTIRKILYGGFRSTDTATLTVLERAYIPTDAHSWAKFYKNNDINKLTPYSYSEGLTICNTTEASSGLSQTITAPPLIRVAKGDYTLWAGNDGWQCRWQEFMSPLGLGNGNVPALTGMSASSTSPSSSATGSADFVARVQVCASAALVGDETCKNYANNLKPTGLLQEFGDDQNMSFGLMTGSYKKGKDGGVLRKNIGPFTDEVNADGTFTSAGGIVNTVNKLRITGYKHSNGLYNDSDADNCIWLKSSFNNDQCRNWGNPQAEIYLESLRYLAGKSANALYTSSPDDSSLITGLSTASFVDPIPAAESCASLSIIQFNASTTSYDADNLGASTDIITASPTLNGRTDAIGAGEPLSGQYFIGENGVDNNQLCTPKTVTTSGTTALSSLRGTCSDAPRLSGSYHITGLAHYAHTNDIRPSLSNKQTVTTYGIALSPAVPKVVVKVPGDATKKITILPACRNTTSAAGHTTPTNCTIVEFKIVNQTSDSTTATGKLYVNWEDSEQGGDYDKDQWGVLNYTITSSTVRIETDVFTAIGSGIMGFGYVINGTTNDGFHVHSGINSFNFTDPTGGLGCTNCVVGDSATSRTYSIGTSSAKSLEQPLYYAAKWGGFTDSNSNGIPDLTSEWDTINNVTGVATPDGVPDKYFSATNPKVLESSLGTALEAIALGDGAASAVATNSTQLNAGSLVYQATFNPIGWSGNIEAFSVDTSTGVLTSNWKVSDSGKMPVAASRNILTYNPLGTAGSRGITFTWNNLTCPGPASATCLAGRIISGGKSQQDYLNKLPPATTSDGKGTLRLAWLRGDQTNEKFNRLDTNPAHIFRKRFSVLGDIVNSDPVFVGTDDYGYSGLSGVEGTTYTSFRASASYLARRPMLYVGANDGMLHGFDARKNTTGTDPGGTEIFAYIPNFLFPEISKLTSPLYTHQYYVDGITGVGDVYDPATTSKWRTMLVGAAGAGGRGIFALDVSDPSTFGAATPMWEYTNASDPDLGYTMAQPVIVRLQSGKWAVIMANGYDSDNGRAVLFVLDAITGALLQKIDTGVGPLTAPTRPDKNGLSSPIGVDTNNDRSVDTVYAGDLYGNLWKFNLSGTPGSWPVPTSPIFVACTTADGSACSAANRQPITSKPNVGKVGGIGTDQNNVGIMVYFGTGKFFETGDNLLPTLPAVPQVQTFYGLWDTGTLITNRSLLKEQAIEFEGKLETNCGTASCDVTGKKIRIVTKDPVCYATTTVGCTSASPLKKGWALNLLVNPGTVKTGERVVSLPLVRRGVVVFSTVIPNPEPCGNGGTSNLMELDALTGGEPPFAPFDTNGNTKVDSTDYVSYGGVMRAASGIGQDIGITKQPAVIESPTNPVDFKYSSGSSTAMGTVVDNANGGTTPPECGSEPCSGKPGMRRSWRQLNTY